MGLLVLSYLLYHCLGLSVEGLVYWGMSGPPWCVVREFGRAAVVDADAGHSGSIGDDVVGGEGFGEQVVLGPGLYPCHRW